MDHTHRRYIKKNYVTKFTAACRDCDWEMVYEDEVFDEDTINNWEEEFKRLIESFDDWSMDENGDDYYDPNIDLDKVKQFIHTTRQEAYDEGKNDTQIKLADKLYDTASKYDDCVEKFIEAKQQARDEIVEMIDESHKDGIYGDELFYNQALNDIINKIKQL